MYYIILLFGGVTLGLMISLNGQLANYLNIFEISLIVHAIGMVLLFLYIKIVQKGKISFRGLPRYVYTVGIYGILLVVSGSLCTNKLGATLTMALSIAGQIFISTMIDHFGLFGNTVTKFQIKKIPGYVLLGVGIMILLL